MRGKQVHSRVSTGAGRTGQPPVVLVHGLVVSSLYLLPVAEILARDFDVYIPDLPGFGRSQPAPGCTTIEGMADWLVEYLDAAGLERSSFLANSMGCQIAIEVAVRYPERVRNVVLSGPVVDPQGRSIPRLVWQSLQVYPRERLSLIRIHAIDYLRAGPRLLLRTLVTMMRYPIETRLPLIPDPVLVVRGDYDALVPRRWARECAELLPRGALIELPGAAHTTNYSHPLELARVSRPFLARAGETTSLREDSA